MTTPRKTSSILDNAHAGAQQTQSALQQAEFSKLQYRYELIADPAERLKVQSAALGILRLQRRRNDDLIAIGRIFLEVKTILKHGQFVEWIEAEFGYRYRAAAEEMAIARRFDGNDAVIAHLTPTVVRLLAGPSVPDEAVKATLELAIEQGTSPTVPQTKIILRALTPPEPTDRRRRRPNTIVVEGASNDVEVADLATVMMPRDLVVSLRNAAVHGLFRSSLPGDQIVALIHAANEALGIPANEQSEISYKRS